jgi:hypothetical protein
MELFLNILWVVIAAAGLSVWRIRWVHQPRARQYAAWRQWAAFICALVLLFFMVSLTDDLHSGLIIFEECSAGRRHAVCLVCPHHALQNHATGKVYAALVVPNFAYGLARIGPVVPDKQPSEIFSHASLSSGRAPPVVSL